MAQTDLPDVIRLGAVRVFLSVCPCLPEDHCEARPYNGQLCTVVDRMRSGGWVVRFDDGETMFAYPDELLRPPS